MCADVDVPLAISARLVSSPGADDIADGSPGGLPVDPLGGLPVDPLGDLPVDPDVEVSDRLAAGPVGRLRSVRRVLVDRWDVLAVIGLGGAVGSGARWGVAQAVPTAPAGFPWATFEVNVVGGFALGVLMVLVAEVWPPSRYVRPFLGVGLLGGFTTFSTYVLDTRELLVDGHGTVAAAYLFGTLAAGLVAVWLGIAVTRLCTSRRRR